MTRAQLLKNVSWSAAAAAGFLLIAITRLSSEFGQGLDGALALGPLGAAFYLARKTERVATLNDGAKDWLEHVLGLAIMGGLYSLVCILVFGLPLGLLLGDQYGLGLIVSDKALSIFSGLFPLIPPLYWYFRLPSQAPRTDSGDS